VSTGAAERLRNASPDPGDVLDHLTISYAENFDRHGPLFGVEGTAAPADDITFAAEATRKAAAIDAATTSNGKGFALLDKEAHRHEQTGRLAVYIAGYEAAHGDAGHVAPMQELGRDHLKIAAVLRSQAEALRPAEIDHDGPAKAWTDADHTPDLLADFVTVETRTLVALDHTNQNERGPSGRDR
jgi:hypothetical protein